MAISRIQPALQTVAIMIAAVAAIIALSPPAFSRDRPGTPNQQLLANCVEHDDSYRPTLCGSFRNTASEEVRFEMEATRNGVKVSLGNLACLNDHSVGLCYDPSNKYQRKDNFDPNVVMGFQTGGVDFGVEYCVRFR